MARFAQTGFGARTWALRLSCGVVVEAAEKALCDRISGLVRMVRSPWHLPMEGELPSLGGATGWLHSPPLTPAGLRGKVVLVQFWTYTCINPTATLIARGLLAQRFTGV